MPRPGSGFTLIELTVVIAIIGVLSMLAAYYIQGDQSQRMLKAEAWRLYAAFQQTSDDAAMYDDTLGIDIADNHCRLMRYDDADGWQEVKDNGQPYEVPERIRVTVERNKNKSKSVVAAFQETSPAVVFYASGDISPFRITLQLKDMDLPRYVISFNKDNMMTLEERHE